MLLGLLVATLLALGRSTALAASEAESEVPVFGSDVSLVMVPVFVVDREGQARSE